MTAWRAAGTRQLFRAEQLHVEYQGGVRRDHAAGAARAVPFCGRNCQRPLSADAHAGHALVPAADHLAAAKPERERFIAIPRAVELEPFVIRSGLVVQPTGVV